MFRVLRKPLVRNQLLHRSCLLHTSQCQHGYIVLVPEIGENSHATEGVLNSDGLPAFNDITIENCLAAIGHQAATVEKTVKSIEKAVVERDGKVQTIQVFRELDQATGPLDTTWGIAKSLYLGNSTLIPTKSYMNIHERARNARASKYNSKILYNALNNEKKLQENKKTVASTSETETETDDENRLLQKYLLEGRLNGLSLSKDKLSQLKEILSHLGKERANFRNKVNMSVHTFAHNISNFELVREFPSDLLEPIARDPNQPMQGPWKLTLQPQLVDGFLKYCPDRMQRWNVWLANARKASGQLEKSLENSTHLEKIRGLRQRQANFLGFPTFADMSMETKMVKNVEELRLIFSNLLKFAGPAQLSEIEDLQNFAVERGFDKKLEVYDVPFWRRKYLLAKHNLNEEMLKEYFPLPRVLSGLFSLTEKLFNIKIVEREKAEVWQPAVKYFDVIDCSDEGSDGNGGSKPIGGFYIDCYSKENKFGKNNGWMVSIRNRNDAANLTPLCAIIFNFNSPIYGKPHLLSVDDLQMVFKTFGSAMQHLLTKAAYTDLAGLSNIEWDASQISSNVLCNFLDNKSILKTLSGHYGNDDPIPDDMAEGVKLLKTNMAGYNLCNELYLADLDIELHRSTDFWLDIVKRMWPMYHCMPLDKKDAHPCSMTDIFSGDWAAAYFSHLYSKMVAADVSDAFLQQPLDDMPAVGKRYRETFLALGGSVPTAEVFRRFRGRDPSLEALLKSLDLYQLTPTTDNL